MANLAAPPKLAVNAQTFAIEDDFWQDQSDINAIDTVSDSGSVTIGDAANGIVALVPSDGTVADNDEAYLESPNEVFLVAAGREMGCEFRVQFTEANTDDANVAVGFASAVAGDLIVDDGAGLRASGNIFAIYKVDGETVWRCVSRNGSTVYTSQSTTTAGGASYQELRINITDQGGTYVHVTFQVNDAYLVDSTTGQRIVHIVPVASSTEMALFAGVKNGGANLETLNLDYWAGWQTR